MPKHSAKLRPLPWKVGDIEPSAQLMSPLNIGLTRLWLRASQVLAAGAGSLSAHVSTHHVYQTVLLGGLATSLAKSAMASSLQPHVALFRVGLTWSQLAPSPSFHGRSSATRQRLVDRADHGGGRCMSLAPMSLFGCLGLKIYGAGSLATATFAKRLGGR